MRGRKPIPTTLKKLHGNPGLAKLNEHEPRPVGELGEPPPYFNDMQRTIWDYTIRNAPPGMLKAIDRAVVVSLVVHEALFAEAVVRQNELGLLTRYGPPPPQGTPDNRAVIQSPYLSIVNKQSALIRAAASDLGLTPVARTRIVAVAQGAGLPAVPQNVADAEGTVSLDDYLAAAPVPPGVH
jgi:phage terminase small subunit